MPDNQLVIKIVLIAVFVLFTIVLLLPGRGDRYLAMRRLALALVFLAAIIAIAFPELINAVAVMVGVGRGTDLVLYAMVIVFIGNTITSSLRYRHQEREITELARRIALSETTPPSASGVDAEQT